MGREVRRVPVGWIHPKNEAGRYQPLFDRAYEEALNEWIAGREAWNAPGNEQAKAHGCTWEEWEGKAPDPDYYRPAWPPGTATAYQVYETVSEGTPVSPVFETREQLIEWLCNDGRGMGIGGTRSPLSREAAERFVETARAPSIIAIPGIGILPGTAVHEPSPRPSTDKEGA
jgi:hypothetical protein